MDFLDEVLGGMDSTDNLTDQLNNVNTPSTGGFDMGGMLGGTDGSGGNTGLKELLGLGNPDLKSTLANYGNNGSFVDNLLSQLGGKLFNKKDPLSSLASIVGALGIIRNMQSGNSSNDKQMQKVTDLVNSPQNFYAANTVQTARRPTARGSNEFIVTPPPSTGPLTLIKGGSNG